MSYRYLAVVGKRGLLFSTLTELPVFVQIRWRPIPAAAIDLLGGVALAGHLRVEDNDGDRIADDGYDAAPFVGLKGQIFF